MENIAEKQRKAKLTHSSSSSCCSNPSEGPAFDKELENVVVNDLSGSKQHYKNNTNKYERCTINNNNCNGSFSSSCSGGLSARKLGARLWERKGEWNNLHSNNPSPNTSAKKYQIHPVTRSFNRTFQKTEDANRTHAFKVGGMKSNCHQTLKSQKDRQIHCSTLNNEINSDVGDSTHLHFTLERATKWDCGQTDSNGAFKVYNGIKTLEEQQTVSVSVVTALKKELDQAHQLVQELEHAQRYSRKEVDRFLKKIAEERAIWQDKEQEKVRLMVRNLKQELHKERKVKKKLEAHNGKIAKELAESKINAMRSLQELEKERKARKLMEDVCDELAREIGEDKAQVEELKRESMKVREEVEEERKMLQMAEVWREERVQMKLIEAKLALEEKSAALDKLREGLESFINSRATAQANGVATDVAADMRNAQLLKEAANSIQIHDIKEFSYEPPSSDDIFSAFEDLNHVQTNNEASDARVGPDFDNGNCYSPGSTCRGHPVTPESQGMNKGYGRNRHSLGYDDDGSVSCMREDEDDREENEDDELGEEESEWEYASEAVVRASSVSSGESKTSLNEGETNNSFSESGTEWEDNRRSSFTEITEYPIIQGQQKSSSTTHSWVKGDNFKSMQSDKIHPSGIKSNISMASASPQCNDAVNSPSKIGAWSSPDSGNPHIARGIKGFIEWPRGIQKSTLKAKLMEAKMESQKSQLRHVLKQKH